VTVKYLYFWGHQPERDGSVGSGCLSQAKFGADPALRGYLLGTGDRVLVEASPIDSIWGIGLSRDDPDAADPARWRGLNLLGQALMQVRSALRDPASA
jgi:ribA/ribD-fused uncharacterized protein